MLKRLFLMVTLQQIIISFVFAQPIEFISENLISGTYTNGVHKNNHVYMTSRYGVDVIDISDESNPQLVNQVRIKGANRLFEVDNTLYVFSRIPVTTSGFRSSLTVIDISNPSTPSVAFTSEQMGGHDMVVKNDVAYISQGFDIQGPPGIHLIDITSPLNPQYLDSIQVSVAFSEIEHHENRLYAVTFDQIYIFDISDSTSVELLFVADLPTQYVTSFDFFQNFLYISDYNTMYTFNLSDLSQVATMTYPALSQVFIAGNFAYLSSSAGLIVLDLQNPENPQEIVVYPALRYFIIDMLTDFAVLHSGTEVVFVEMNTEEWEIIGHYAIPHGQSQNVFVMNEIAFVSLEKRVHNGIVGNFPYLATLDLSNVAAPEVLDTLFIQTPHAQMAAYGDYLYLVEDSDRGQNDAGGLSLEIVDISNPDALILINSMSLGYKRGGLTVAGNYLYVYDTRFGHFFEGAMDIYDLTVPDQPQLVADYEFPFAPYKVLIQGNYAYALCHNLGLQILDITNPTEPILVSEVVISGGLDLSLDGNFACVVSPWVGIYLIDIEDATTPSIQMTYETPERDLIRCQLVGNNVVAIDEYDGLVIYDWSQESEIDFWESAGIPLNLTVSDDNIYLADLYDVAINHFAGFLGVESTIMPMSVLQQNYPNPWFLSPAKGNPSTTIAFNLPSKQAVTLRIYNTAGQLVKTLLDGTHSTPAGTHEVTWDGRNEHGLPVSSGVYFYRLEAGSTNSPFEGGQGDVIQTRRMVLLR